MLSLPRFLTSKKCFFLLLFVLSLTPALSARQNAVPEESGQEASAFQAQATLASLFGRGAKMPGIPRVDGTIALPSFDSSEIKVDEGSLDMARRQGAKNRDPRFEA